MPYWLSMFLALVTGLTGKSSSSESIRFQVNREIGSALIPFILKNKMAMKNNHNWFKHNKNYNDLLYTRNVT